jgi:dipeptidyl aminopeptidase/acylaminoacyl peptidase
VIVGLLAIVAGGAWLARSRALGLVHPDRTYADETPDDYGITEWEPVEFLSSDGLKLFGWFISPGPDADGATVIYAHGWGSNRGELLADAAMLNGHGYGALLFDFRNSGESEGNATTLGYTEVNDVQGAVDYLLAREDVNPERIGLIGHSMGGATVLRAAARIPEVRAVVAESAYTSLEDNIAEGVERLAGLPAFPFAPLVVWFGELESGINLSQVRPLDDVAQISPRALLLVHGELDGLVGVDNAHTLFEAAGEPKELYIIPNAEHSYLFEADPVTYEQRVAGFLNEYLGS